MKLDVIKLFHVVQIALLTWAIVLLLGIIGYTCVQVYDEAKEQAATLSSNLLSTPVYADNDSGNECSLCEDRGDETRLKGGSN